MHCTFPRPEKTRNTIRSGQAQVVMTRKRLFWPIKIHGRNPRNIQVGKNLINKIKGGKSRRGSGAAPPGPTPPAREIQGALTTSPLGPPFSWGRSSALQAQAQLWQREGARRPLLTRHENACKARRRQGLHQTVNFGKRRKNRAKFVSRVESH